MGSFAGGASQGMNQGILNQARMQAIQAYLAQQRQQGQAVNNLGGGGPGLSGMDMLAAGAPGLQNNPQALQGALSSILGMGGGGLPGGAPGGGGMAAGVPPAAMGGLPGPGGGGNPILAAILGTPLGGASAAMAAPGAMGNMRMPGGVPPVSAPQPPSLPSPPLPPMGGGGGNLPFTGDAAQPMTPADGGQADSEAAGSDPFGAALARHPELTALFKRVDPEAVALRIKERNPGISDQDLYGATKAWLDLGQQGNHLEQVYAATMLRELFQTERTGMQQAGAAGRVAQQQTGATARTNIREGGRLTISREARASIERLAQQREQIRTSQADSQAKLRALLAGRDRVTTEKNVAVQQSHAADAAEYDKEIAAYDALIMQLTGQDMPEHYIQPGAPPGATP